MQEIYEVPNICIIKVCYLKNQSLTELEVCTLSNINTALNSTTHSVFTFFPIHKFNKSTHRGL